jgi:hypothetical protein
MILAAILDGYSRRKDGSLTIRFVTNELNTLQVAKVDELYNKFGVLYFKDKEQMDDAEIEELDAIDFDMYDNPKTQSQRLRGVLYKNWEASTQEIDFKTYYKQETEKIINHYKKKIE